VQVGLAAPIAGKRYPGRTVGEVSSPFLCQNSSPMSNAIETSAAVYTPFGKNLKTGKSP
jgi:hypothetical protein